MPPQTITLQDCSDDHSYLYFILFLFGLSHICIENQKNNRSQHQAPNKLKNIFALIITRVIISEWPPYLRQRLETRPWHPSVGPSPQTPAGSWASQPQSPSCPAVATKAAACRGSPAPPHNSFPHNDVLCVVLVWFKVVTQSYPTALTESGPIGSGGSVSSRKRQLRRSKGTSMDSGGNDRRAWIRRKTTDPPQRTDKCCAFSK